MIIEGFFSLLSNILVFTSRIEGGNTFPQPLSPEKEQEYLKKFKENGDIEAKNILIKHNLRLVVFIAKKYTNYPDLDELISIGTLGLIKAIATFDQNKKTALATYASRCIENEILMTMRSYKKHANDISIFDRIGTDKEGNDMILMDLLSIDEDSIYQKIDGDILKDKLVGLMGECLTQRENVIIRLRFGLDDGIPKTQQVVADGLNISRSYISRIEKRAFSKLKERLIKSYGEDWSDLSPN